MKLIVEITQMDDKCVKHECNDFPNVGSDFVTLYKDGFRRELISTRSVQRMDYYFKK